MRIYLTSSAKDANALLELRIWLEQQGHKIMSSWFDRPAGTIADELEAAFDLIELDESTALLAYSPEGVDAIGGQGFEAGYAYRSGKRLFYIGRPTNHFMRKYGQPWQVIYIPKA